MEGPTRDCPAQRREARLSKARFSGLNQRRRQAGPTVPDLVRPWQMAPALRIPNTGIDLSIVARTKSRWHRSGVR